MPQYDSFACWPADPEKYKTPSRALLTLAASHSPFTSFPVPPVWITSTGPDSFSTRARKTATYAHEASFNCSRLPLIALFRVPLSVAQIAAIALRLPSSAPGASVDAATARIRSVIVPICCCIVSPI